MKVTNVGAHSKSNMYIIPSDKPASTTTYIPRPIFTNGQLHARLSAMPVCQHNHVSMTNSHKVARYMPGHLLHYKSSTTMHRVVPRFSLHANKRLKGMERASHKPSLCVLPHEKWSGEQSQISWTYSPKW